MNIVAYIFKCKFIPNKLSHRIQYLNLMSDYQQSMSILKHDILHNKHIKLQFYLKKKRILFILI